MTVTPEDWETELESVEQVAALTRDTIPAPPPTELQHEPPTMLPHVPHICSACGADLRTADHDPACPNAAVIS